MAGWVIRRCQGNRDRPSLDAAAGALYDPLARIRAAGGVDPAALRFTVRLQALELNYHELGGLFDQLAAAGRIDAVVVTPPVFDGAPRPVVGS